VHHDESLHPPQPRRKPEKPSFKKWEKAKSPKLLLKRKSRCHQRGELKTKTVGGNLQETGKCRQEEKNALSADKGRTSGRPRQTKWQKKVRSTLGTTGIKNITKAGLFMKKETKKGCSSQKAGGPSYFWEKISPLYDSTWVSSSRKGGKMEKPIAPGLIALRKKVRNIYNRSVQGKSAEGKNREVIAKARR